VRDLIEVPAYEYGGYEQEGFAPARIDAAPVTEKKIYCARPIVARGLVKNDGGASGLS
jgi:hypothetical protein